MFLVEMARCAIPARVQRAERMETTSLAWNIGSVA
jgi:hypothetical protein